MALIFLDAQKAFDNVNWRFMLLLLEQMGFARKFIQAIEATYYKQTAKVMIEGELTDSINIRKGTRQGCPLSPLLFVLTLEVLNRNIRDEKNIKGMKIKKEEFKLQVFADDLVFILEDPLETASKLIEKIETYGKVICRKYFPVYLFQIWILFFFISMSLLNNSCDPNCVVIFEGPQLHLRSIREMQLGEELTISYTETVMPTPERQQNLKRQYCFECDCIMCSTPSKVSQLNLSFDQVIWVNTCAEKWEQVLLSCQTLLKSNTSRLPDTNIYQLKLLDLAMDACINLGLWEEALHYGNRTLEPYRFYYPGFHPLRAIQMMRVAKLQYHQDIGIPSSITKLTHGTEHSLTQDLMILKEDQLTASY
uniref:SET and MYND domain containing 3 n=1 Tax=Pseudonaja textilis TaxID=8673 RepID=A0A670ZAE6_PSETE